VNDLAWLGRAYPEASNAMGDALSALWRDVCGRAEGLGIDCVLSVAGFVDAWRPGSTRWFTVSNRPGGPTIDTMMELFRIASEMSGESVDRLLSLLRSEGPSRAVHDLAASADRQDTNLGCAAVVCK